MQNSVRIEGNVGVQGTNSRDWIRFAGVDESLGSVRSPERCTATTRSQPLQKMP